MNRSMNLRTYMKDERDLHDTKDVGSRGGNVSRRNLKPELQAAEATRRYKGRYANEQGARTSRSVVQNTQFAGQNSVTE